MGMTNPPILFLFLLLLLPHLVFGDVRSSDDDEAVPSAPSSINADEDLGGLNTEWLTDEQLSELASVEGDEKRMEKVREFYEALEGEAKKAATEKIISDCYGWLEEVATEEERKALKQMHHQNHDKCRERVRELMGRLEMSRRDQVEKRLGFCEHVWYANTDEGGDHQHHHHHHHKRWVHRHRRDHHHHEGHEDHHGHHGLGDYFKTHLSWLSDAQKEELKGMKEAGKSRAEMKDKVLVWYNETSGETREKATELLKGGCRELIRMVLGEDKANKVKEMKESGTDYAKIAEQLNEWIAEVTDEKKKELANEYRGICAKVFGVKGPNGRRRRSWHNRERGSSRRHHQDVEEGRNDDEAEIRVGGDDEADMGETEDSVDGEHLQHHNSWLSRKQRKMLKKMRDRGHGDHELHERIHEFYEVSPDEVKATAKGILQSGCESILKRIFGEYKAEEIIQMREEGASNGEIEEKITEALNQIRNPQKREEAARFAMSCRRIFTMIERRRRSVSGSAPTETLEELFKSHLSWLSAGQQDELKALRDGGQGRTEMQQKVMGWYGEMEEGQAKQKAREHLKDGCRELLVFVMGKENADELKMLKQNGASENALEAKASEMLAQVPKGEKKAKAKEFGQICKKLLMEP